MQRLRNTIDGFAEEQTRQRPQKSPSRRTTPSSRLQPPIQRPQEQREPSSDTLVVGDPDPSAFDAEFIIGSNDTPSRSNTPVPASRDLETAEAEGFKHGGQVAEVEHADNSKSHASEAESASSELPSEVRGKLRRLNKLETKYQGTRVAAIPCLRTS